jgi:DNA-3-methyladenine glycosylase II
MQGTTLAVTPPFRLDLTANVLRRLSTNVVDTFDGTTYRRALGEGTPSLLTVEQTAPDRLTVSLAGPAAASPDAAALAARMLGTGVDLSAFGAAAAHVPWLAPIVRGALGVKPPRYPSLWEACVNAIVYQQVSIYAAGAILRRVIERHATALTLGDVRLHVFPGPAVLLAADPAELRSLGLSINKIASLQAVARAVLDGSLDEDALVTLPTPDLMHALVAHRGIGPWTAAVIALRGFGRLDLFPMNDSGVARSIRDLSGTNDVDVAALLAALGAQRGMLYYHLLLGRLAARGDVELSARLAESERT